MAEIGHKFSNLYLIERKHYLPTFWFIVTVNVTSSGAGNGLVPFGAKPLPERIDDTIQWHIGLYASSGFSAFIILGTLTVIITD